MYPRYGTGYPSMGILDSRALGRALLSVMFLSAAYNKVVNWDVTREWVHNTMDGKGFALDRLFGVDDVGWVPLLLALAVLAEAGGTWRSYDCPQNDVHIVVMCMRSCIRVWGMRVAAFPCVTTTVDRSSGCWLGGLQAHYSCSSASMSWALES